MDLQQIKALMDAMASSELEEMEISHEGWTLRLVKSARPKTALQAEARPPAAMAMDSAQRTEAGSLKPAPPPMNAGTHEIKAPMFGLVHLQQAPDEPPFVKPGDVIQAGQLLCTIEAMKVFNEVRAERAGRVAAVLVSSGAEVETGQALMSVEQVDHV